MIIDSETYGIMVIEDNQDLNVAYTQILESTELFHRVESFLNCEDALAQLKKTLPDIVLIDLDLPGMSGIEGIKQIKLLHPGIKIMVITVHEDSDHVFDALCSGANGYITKRSDHIQLIKAVKEVLQGGAPMSRRIANMVVSSFRKNPESPLTARETDVLKLLAKGKTYKGVANALSLSIDTIKTHIQHIYGKLQVNSKADALEEARKQKLV